MRQHVSVRETDFGTKGVTIKKLKQINREAPAVFDRIIFRYWQKVYSAAVRFCPVDTGALRASIRIKKGRNTMGQYVVGRTNPMSEYYIFAGGGGVINPKHKKEVDYARAVHDGTAHNPPNPFLDRAILSLKGEQDMILKKLADWASKEWSKDQPPAPSMWKVELPVSTG